MAKAFLMIHRVGVQMGESFRLPFSLTILMVLLGFGSLHATVTDRTNNYLFSGSSNSLSISKTNGSILEVKGTAATSIAANGVEGLWALDLADGTALTATSFLSGGGTLSTTLVSNILTLTYGRTDLEVVVTITERADGVEMAGRVTPAAGGPTVLALHLPATLRFSNTSVQRLIAPSHSSDGVGMAYNAGFFTVQTEDNAATWKRVVQADGGAGYRSLYNNTGLIFTNDTPVALTFSSDGQTWLGSTVVNSWSNSTAVVNRPPAAGQSDLVLIDSPNGPYFSGSKLGGTGGYFLRIGGNVNGTQAVDRSLDIVTAAAKYLAQNPGVRTKVGLLSMERGPVTGVTWPSEVRLDQWASRLREVLPTGIQVVPITDISGLIAAATSTESSIPTGSYCRPPSPAELPGP